MRSASARLDEVASELGQIAPVPPRFLRLVHGGFPPPRSSMSVSAPNTPTPTLAVTGIRRGRPASPFRGGSRSQHT